MRLFDRQRPQGQQKPIKPFRQYDDDPHTNKPQDKIPKTTNENLKPKDRAKRIGRGLWSILTKD
ncbi:hypothetical protein KC945_02820, partial [Candidatus Saccharibacteria bacterium]|nr:hypothetical protein [Candidatus Saccharibacteria bacterium]